MLILSAEERVCTCEDAVGVVMECLLGGACDGCNGVVCGLYHQQRYCHVPHPLCRACSLVVVVHCVESCTVLTFNTPQNMLLVGSRSQFNINCLSRYELSVWGAGRHWRHTEEPCMLLFIMHTAQFLDNSFYNNQRSKILQSSKKQQETKEINNETVGANSSRDEHQRRHG